jgi:hypothetical protein
MAKGGGASRPRFRLLPTVLLTAAILLLPTAVYAWGRTSDSFTVRRVEVSGTDVVPRRQVLRLLRHDYLNRNLFTVTTAGVRHTLAPLAYVAGVHIDRAFPHDLRVRVVEYQPALFAYAGGRWYVVAADGRVICEQAVTKKEKSGGDQQATATDAGASAAAETTVSAQAGDGTALSAKELHVLDVLQAGPQGATLDLPRMAVPGSLKPGSAVADAGVHDALAVIVGLPSSLRGDVAVAEASGDSQLTLRFAGGPLVVWGEPSRSQAKTLALRAVLSRYRETGKTCTFADISVPDRVLARPVLK